MPAKKKLVNNYPLIRRVAAPVVEVIAFPDEVIVVTRGEVALTLKEAQTLIDNLVAAVAQAPLLDWDLEENKLILKSDKPTVDKPARKPRASKGIDLDGVTS